MDGGHRQRHRPGELRHLEWAWVDWEDAGLTLPSSLMKRTKAEKGEAEANAEQKAAQAAGKVVIISPV